MSDSLWRLVVLADFPDQNPALDPPRSHTVYLYLPENYHESTDRYPVIYLHDGNDMFLSPKPWQVDQQTMMLDVVLDNMVAMGQCRPAILVGIVPSVVGRNIELPHLARKEDDKFGAGWGGGVDDYYSFIATQLKPYIDSHYRTETSPQFTGIGGASFGGLASLYMAYHHPETFGMCWCMSPSLWWDEEKLLLDLEADQSPRNEVRYWFCAGANEPPIMWQVAWRAAAAMQRRGWVEGRDVVYYHDYVGAHDYALWRAMAPEMCRFMLGHEPLKLSGIRLHQVADPDGRPIKAINVALEPAITMELLYEGGYRHNAITPQIRSLHPQIVEIQYTGPIPRLHVRNNGLAVLRGEYQHHQASQIVTSYHPVPENHATYECPPAAHLLDVEQPLSDWPTLLYSLDDCTPEPPPPDAKVTPVGGKPIDPPSGLDLSQPPKPTPRCRFGVWAGERGLYIGIEVIKPELYYTANVLPWQQDGIELRIDARPDPHRYNGIGDMEMEAFLLVGISPDPDGSLASLHQPDKLPMGTRVSCKRIDGGYTLQVEISARYLDAVQKKPWNECRINLTLNVAPAPNAFPWKYWWQPDWRGQNNVLGSGTFYRVLPPEPDDNGSGR